MRLLARNARPSEPGGACEAPASRTMLNGMRRLKMLGVLDRPAYTLPEAASYLAIPSSTLRAWVNAKAIFEPARCTPVRMSFNNLVEAHVLGALRGEGVRLQAIISALEYMRDDLRMRRPLLDAKLETDGINVFVEHVGKLVQVTTAAGQVCIEKALRDHLRRIERDLTGVPIRLFPFGPGEPEERPVVIDPNLSFGRPVIAGTGIATAMVAERFAGGETKLELAEDYGVEEALIEAAISYEAKKAA